MKLTYETSNDIEIQQELNESTGGKKYKIRGIFSSPGQKNRNGRIYPMNIWEREVAAYQDIIKTGHMNSLMEYQHPPRSNVDPMEAVAKTTKLWIENGYVMGESVLLDNPKANQLKTLIDNGIKMAVSTRGVGKVGSNGIVEDYKLICIDIVTEQSDHMAEMYGITEGILKDKEYDFNEKGDLVEICCKDKCLREHRQDVNEAVLSIFDSLFTLNEMNTFAPKFIDELDVRTDKLKELIKNDKIEPRVIYKEFDDFIKFLSNNKSNF